MPFGKTYSSLIEPALAAMTPQSSRFGPDNNIAFGAPVRPVPFYIVREAACPLFCLAGYVSEATRMRSTRSCRGLAGASIAVPSTSPQYASSSRKSGG
jgi:hypothetical protein